MIGFLSSPYLATKNTLVIDNIGRSCNKDRNNFFSIEKNIFESLRHD